MQEQNRYLDYLIDPGFQGVHRLFFFYNLIKNTGLASYKRYYPLQVEIKDYNVMINGENLFDQPVKNNLGTYDNIRKVSTGQVDD